MTLAVGWHYLSSDTPTARPSAATFLDVAGATPGMSAAERMVRIYFKGRPQPQELAQKARTWPGLRVQIGNEPNLPQEEFGGGPVDYAAFFGAIRDLAPDARLYWAGMSPGVPGWQDWYRGAGHQAVSGVCVHAYGSLEQIKDTVWQVRELCPGKKLWLGEFNFGAGQQVDLDAWARATIGPLFDWLATIPEVEAATWFAYRWPTPDMHLPTPVDGAGTAVEIEIAKWMGRQWEASNGADHSTEVAGSDRAAQPGPQEGVRPDSGAGAADPGGRGEEERGVDAAVPQETKLTRDELVKLVRDTATRNGYDPDVAERQVTVESDFDPNAGSDAGAQGLWQIVPKYHPGVDPYDPVAATEYATKWMAELVTQYDGDVRRALIHYNGGGGAVQAYESLSTYDESARYVTAILDAPRGDSTAAQFGPELAAEGFGQDWIGSACGPIALAGALRMLGVGDLASWEPTQVAEAVLRSAPNHGWTPEGGMNGPVNFVHLAESWRVLADPIVAENAREWLVRGCPVVLSTAHHYYLAQRRSRVANDLEVFVGHTGLARIGGSEWMTVEAISDLDGGINAAWALSYTGASEPAGESAVTLAPDLTPWKPADVPPAVSEAIETLWVHADGDTAKQQAVGDLKVAWGLQEVA